MKAGQQAKGQPLPLNTVKKLATTAATLGAMIMAPVQGLFSQMSLGVDFQEIALPTAP